MANGVGNLKIISCDVNNLAEMQNVSDLATDNQFLKCKQFCNKNYCTLIYLVNR